MKALLFLIIIGVAVWFAYKHFGPGRNQRVLPHQRTDTTRPPGNDHRNDPPV